MKATTKHNIYGAIALGLFLFASSIDQLLLTVGM